LEKVNAIINLIFPLFRGFGLGYNQIKLLFLLISGHDKQMALQKFVKAVATPFL
jgi:hypothetical protein